MRKPMKNTNGFTLVELMVAVLVLAIGLLGLAGLQVTGLSSNHNAYLRTQATLLAQDMADRMRQSQTYDSQKNEAQNQAQNQANLAAYLGGDGSVDCAATNCTVAEMAGYDLAQWHAALAARLPGGTGTVTGGPVYTIRVMWSEHDESQGNNAQGIVQKHLDMSFQP